MGGRGGEQTRARAKTRLAYPPRLCLYRGRGRPFYRRQRPLIVGLRGNLRNGPAKDGRCSIISLYISGVNLVDWRKWLIYRAQKSLCAWFGEFCSCCCRPLPPQLACSILPATYKDFFGLCMYSVHVQSPRKKCFKWLMEYSFYSYLTILPGPT